MCVIINKPREIRLSREIMRQCWRSNPHGAGFMYVESGNLVINKGYMTFESFYRAYKEIDWKKHMVFHFRLASYGSIIPEQTHPMLINEKLAFVHNGHMLNQFIKQATLATDKSKSDTMIFNEEILQKLPQDFLSQPAIVELINGYIDNSIMLFLDNEDNVIILGSLEGTITRDGCWFSNNFWDEDLYMVDEDTAITETEEEVQEIMNKEQLMNENAKGSVINFSYSNIP